MPTLFVPPLRTARGRTSVHVTFPDGSTADVSYPAGLRLAEMGVRPYGSGWLGGRRDGCCFRELVVPPEGESWFARSGPRLRRLPGADGGNVGLYPASDDNFLTPFLVFSFGPWRLGVAVYGSDQMVFDQEAEWARSLHGRVTSDGFLVLRATGRLHLEPPGDLDMTGDTDAGPQLWFGQAYSTWYDSSDPTKSPRIVVLTPTPHCAEEPVRPPRSVAVGLSACKGAHMRVWAGGDRSFATRVTRELTVTNVRLAPDQS